MYGTIAKLRVKKGMGDRLLDMSRLESPSQTTGFMGHFVYRMDKNPDEYYLVVLFTDKDSYFRNAKSPEQDKEYRHMLQFLEGEPEWFDGEIVDSFLTSTEGIPTLRKAA